MTARNQLVAVSVVGVVPGHGLGKAARADLDAADVVFGTPRLLDIVDLPGVTIEPLPGLDELVTRIESARPGQRIVVLASGDPGFFGIVRVLADRLGRERLTVHPAPSSVALAFARLGLPWDDATVVSAHGRPLTAAVDALRAASKAAVLVAPDQPPHALGAALLAAGVHFDHAAVCAWLGTDAELVAETDLDGLAAGEWDDLSVVVLWSGSGVAAEPSVRFGRPAEAFAHRAGMITKDEVRAVVLAKLDLPATGVLWDVGAGSGSVAIEAAALAPGLEVYAVERNPDDVERIRTNAEAHGVRVHVIAGEADQVIPTLPAPDRVFIGGGGPVVLDAALDRLQPDGCIVASSATLQMALAAYQRLGSMVQVTIERAVPVGSAGVRLAATNPVFVAWGPNR